MSHQTISHLPTLLGHMRYAPLDFKITAPTREEFKYGWHSHELIIDDKIMIFGDINTIYQILFMHLSSIETIKIVS